MKMIAETQTICAHCGEPCDPSGIRVGDTPFCCQGCQMVFQLLNDTGLCSYYSLNANPGINRRVPVRADKFAFLDEDRMAAGLIRFRNDAETHAIFYLPQIHCSSCLYLLEKLHRIHPGISSSRVDFEGRELSVIFDPSRITLREIAELLTSLGYEPHISLGDLGNKRPGPNRSLIYRVGIAGFCFGNTMLLAFSEYLGLDVTETSLRLSFRYLSLALSLPVLFYCAYPFYSSAWKSLRRRFLNIDLPIVLAILVTFGRSVWEVLTGAGPGYFDSLSGIVFFMLVGRYLQERTYRRLSFDRDYTSYFPISVTVLTQSGKSVKPLPEIKSGDVLLIHSGELIPADGVLTKGDASIDYSFVTGESTQVEAGIGELLYAGGRQAGAAFEMIVTREVVQSYLTQLWNRGPRATEINTRPTGGSSWKDELAAGHFRFVNILSRYFTYVVMTIAGAALVYWQSQDPSRTWNAFTAVLIVACPCALLLSATFTNGHLLRILAGYRCYLRDAGVIEQMATATHIVFDKTGTLTDNSRQDVRFVPINPDPADAEADMPDHTDLGVFHQLASQSIHPVSRTLAEYLSPDRPASRPTEFSEFRELPGQGIEGRAGGKLYSIGSWAFVLGEKRVKATGIGAQDPGVHGTHVFIAIDHRPAGYYCFSSVYREGIDEMLSRLSPRLGISVVSGDTARERHRLLELFGQKATLMFGQTPERKTRYVKQLQSSGQRVMMIGDGLNDAGALSQSEAGIALAPDLNQFTPASDVILRADQIRLLPSILRLCKAGRSIIIVSFLVSIVYNLVGLYFAVRGNLSPMVAAILMPASSLSIPLVTYGASGLAGKLLMGKSGSRPRETSGQPVEKDHAPG